MKHSKEWRKNQSEKMKGNCNAIGCDASKLIKRNKEDNPMKNPKSKQKWKESRLKGIEKSMGVNNPGYVDGASCGKNTKEILDLKEKIRKNANYECQECDKTQEQNKKETGEILSVHHIDGNDINNEPENLKALCKDCHMKTRYKNSGKTIK